jgi:uncharacterized Fe-S cluster protein YjdI
MSYLGGMFEPQRPCGDSAGEKNNKIMDKNNIVKEYTHGDITVLWQSGKCIHSGNCVRNLSSVFKPKEQPWIQPENASSDAVIDAVNKCPSGALSIK